MVKNGDIEYNKMSAITLRGIVNPHDPSTDRQFSMNLARGMDVLRAFTPTSPVLGNREIASITKLPKPTVSRLTYTLTLLGYLNHDAHLRKYRLGAGVLALGHPLLASMKIRQLARPIMVALAKATGCTVNLGLRDRDSVMYIDSVRPDLTNQYLPDIGSSRPLMLSSIGRALIFSCTPTEGAEVINYLKILKPEAFAKAETLLKADRKRYAEEGYCYAPGDLYAEVYAIAVPIRQPRGELPLAMNCSNVAHSAEAGEKILKSVPLLKEAARQLEAS